MLHQLPVHHLPPAERPRGVLPLISAQYHAKQKENCKEGVDLHRYAFIDAIVGFIVRRYVECLQGQVKINTARDDSAGGSGGTLKSLD